jgi:hypothetical protein
MYFVNAWMTRIILMRLLQGHISKYHVCFCLIIFNLQKNINIQFQFYLFFTLDINIYNSPWKMSVSFLYNFLVVKFKQHKFMYIIEHVILHLIHTSERVLFFIFNYASIFLNHPSVRGILIMAMSHFVRISSAIN